MHAKTHVGRAESGRLNRRGGLSHHAQESQPTSNVRAPEATSEDPFLSNASRCALAKTPRGISQIPLGVKVGFRPIGLIGP